MIMKLVFYRALISHCTLQDSKISLYLLIYLLFNENHKVIVQTLLQTAFENCSIYLSIGSIQNDLTQNSDRVFTTTNLSQRLLFLSNFL